MDLSIKDLIVKTDRPGNGLRDIASQLAAAGGNAASKAAFNDLLNNFRAEPAKPQAPERKVDDQRPARNETETRREEPEARVRETRETPNQAPVDKTARKGEIANGETEHADSNLNIDQATSDTNASVDQKAPQAALQVNVPAGERQVATAGISVTATDTSVATVVTKEPATTAKNTPVNTAQPAPDTAEQAAAANAAGTAAANIANVAKTDNGKAKQPVAMQDFGASPNVAKPADVTDDGNTDLVAALNRIATGNKHSTANAAAPTESQDAPAPTRLPQADSVSKLPDAPRITIADAPDADVAPLRTPVTPGLLALQEVSGTPAKPQGAPAPAASNGVTASNAAANPSTAAAAIAGTDPMPAPAAAAGLTGAIETTNTRPLTQPGALTLDAHGISATGTAKLTQTAATQAARPQPAPQPVPVDDVAVHIARAAANGNDHINIKLKPAALGEVEVKLELTHDGRVAAVVTADRADTLDMLARDAKSLERALADAGLKTDQNSLQFNLRGDGNNGSMANAERDPTGHNSHKNHQPAQPAEGDDGRAGLLSGYANARAGAGGIDIRV